MRAAAVIVLASCGRLGFEPNSFGDAGSVDAAEAVSDLIARYRMDDPPADGVDDATGLHPAGCGSTCPILVAGQRGMGYAFDGADDLIVVPFAPDLAPPGVTVAAWILLEVAPTTRGCVASKKLGNGTADSWALCIEPSLSVLYFSSTTAASRSLLSPAGAIGVGVWQHVAITYDGTDKRCYVAATEIGSQPAPQEYDMHEVLIGGNIDNAALIAMFPGTIDDLQIYSRALDAAELAILATAR